MIRAECEARTVRQNLGHEEGGRGAAWERFAPFQKLAMPLTLAVGLVRPPVEPGSWLSETITLLAQAQRSPRSAAEGLHGPGASL